MKTDNKLPENVKILAQGDWGSKIVYEYQGWIYLRGFGGVDYVWTNKETWNEFAKVIIEATKKINGGVKL